MKLYVRLFILAAAFIVVLAPLGMLKAHAQEAPITDDQISRIRSNCVEVTDTLNQLHADDALLRVNRGQLYESITSKLMVPFNTRISSSPFSSSDLKTITNNYQHTLDAFRTDYQNYEEQLSSTLSINCSDQPVEFYNAIDESRTLRAKVHDDTSALDVLIAQYQTAVMSFEQNYEPAPNGTAQ
jgi:hypothetical protein